LLAARYGGSKGGGPDVAIWASRKSQQKWSMPLVLAPEPHIATWNPVLSYSQDGTRIKLGIIPKDALRIHLHTR
jgi:predicted neuraminidase